MISIFILAQAKTYAKINQPTTDMTIAITTEGMTEKKCSDFVPTFDTNDATDYDIVKVHRNRCFLRVRLQTSVGYILLYSNHGMCVVEKF